MRWIIHSATINSIISTEIPSAPFMLTAEDDILLVHMERAEIFDAFFCFRLHSQSLLPFSTCTNICSEGEELLIVGKQWVWKIWERSALQSLYSHGTRQRLSISAVQYNSITLQLQKSIVIEEVPDNQTETVVPFLRKLKSIQGTIGWSNFSVSKTITEHVLHVLLESSSSTQRAGWGGTSSRESWGQIMLDQVGCLLEWNDWLRGQGKIHELDDKVQCKYSTV